MKTRLTVRVEQRRLESAKCYAARHGTTLTELISDYLEALSGADGLQSDTPILLRLAGIVPTGARVDEHREHLMDKYNSCGAATSA